MRVVPFFVAVFILVPFVARAAVPVAINRVAAYPISDHEWIEVQNTGTEAVDLTGWKFWEDGVNHSITVFQGSLVIEPGQFAVIADRADFFVADHPEYTGTVLDSSWSTLTLTGEPIGLRDPAGTLIEFPDAVWLAEEPTEVFPLPYIEEPPPEEPAPTEPTIPDPPPMVEEPTITTPTSTEIVVDLPTIEEPPVPEIPPSELLPETTTTSSPATEIPSPAEEPLPETVATSTPATEPSPVEETAPSNAPTETETTPPTETVDDPIPEAPVETTTAPLPPIGDVHALLLSEAMPAPLEGSEWVEIHNPTELDIPLEGLKLHDSVGSIATLSGTVPAFGYTVVTLSSARLNNGGDDIKLVAADGSVIDVITYGDDQLPAPEKGQVIARDGELWLVSITATPNGENVMTAPEATVPEEEQDEPEPVPVTEPPLVVTPPAVPVTPPKKPTPKPLPGVKPEKKPVKTTTATTTAKTTAKKEATPKKATAVKKTTARKTIRTYLSRPLSELGLAEDGAYVVTEGTVVGMDPATSGKQWYLQDGDAGVRLSVTGFPPDLEPGLRARVRGKLSWSGGPSLATTAADITTLDAETTVSPTAVELSTLGPTDGHRYVTVHGTVTRVRDRRITLMSNNFNLTVIVPPGVAVPGKDAEVTASGIYQSTAPPTLLVLSPNSLTATHPNPAPPKTKTTTSGKNTKKSPWPMTIGFGTLAAVAGTTIHRARKSRPAQTSPLLIPEDHASSR